MRINCRFLFVTWFPVTGGVWCFRVAALEDREYQMDRLEFVKNQLNLLIDDIKKKIKAISEDVASKVERARSYSSLLVLPVNENNDKWDVNTLKGLTDLKAKLQLDFVKIV